MVFEPWQEGMPCRLSRNRVCVARIAIACDCLNTIGFDVLDTPSRINPRNTPKRIELLSGANPGVQSTGAVK